MLYTTQLVHFVVLMVLTMIPSGAVAYRLQCGWLNLARRCELGRRTCSNKFLVCATNNEHGNNQNDPSNIRRKNEALYKLVKRGNLARRGGGTVSIDETVRGSTQYSVI